MRRKRRVTLFHNHGAGEADHDRSELVSAIRAAGYAVSYHDAKRCDIPAVLKRAADFVVVAGGDGTVRKVALAAVPEGPPIAVLPFGTANNIATSLGLTDSLQALIASWNEARLVNYYPIEVDAPWGRQRLLEGIGFGAFARVIEEESEGDGDKLSPMEARRRLAEAVLSAKPEPLDIRIDDARASDEIVLLEITAIPFVGPNLYLAPDANPSDRLLDICSVSAGDRSAIAQWLETPAPGRAAPLLARASSHIAISDRFERVRLDDDVRTEDPPMQGTITLAAAAQSLSFVVAGQQETRAGVTGPKI